MYMFNCNALIKHNIDYITFIIKQYIDYNNTINYYWCPLKTHKANNFLSAVPPYRYCGYFFLK